MRIGEAAAAAGTTPRALRFYEQRGLLPPPARTGTGQREYGPADVARVRVVRELLSYGLTVEDVAGCADRLDALAGLVPPYGGPGCSSPGGVAERRLATLDAEIARLTLLRDRLAGRLGTTGSPAGPAPGAMPAAVPTSVPTSVPAAVPAAVPAPVPAAARPAGVAR
ncbi:MerR family transcriptional regulator [Sphaerisporangium rufum]|uniref:MerR family transcriptional regulator n=1 Tax=Sphaerisporangium rufum TaxID=1381558 RepID=A0A919V3J6_9ACTN|nr:MerR family transcriptional regulator [Sphaerisporangium rufum]GII80892.1 MerR family transcriptional regulator [Sphaerisporangium rufum]